MGRGLEGKLTDLMSGRVIRERIAPRFRAGDFDGGLTQGAQAVMEVVRGEYKANAEEPVRGRRGAPPILTLLIFLFLALVFIGAISKVFAAVTGAVGLPIVAKLAFSALSLPVLGGLAGLGIVVGLVLSVLFSGGGRSGGEGAGPWLADSEVPSSAAALRPEGRAEAVSSEAVAISEAEGPREAGRSPLKRVGPSHAPVISERMLACNA